jgi:hypothetical protein
LTIIYICLAIYVKKFDKVENLTLLTRKDNATKDPAKVRESWAEIVKEADSERKRRMDEFIKM